MLLLTITVKNLLNSKVHMGLLGALGVIIIFMCLLLTIVCYQNKKRKKFNQLLTEVDIVKKIPLKYKLYRISNLTANNNIASNNLII